MLIPYFKKKNASCGLRFVKAMVDHYYPSDGEVTMDTELQAWIHEIFTYGFLSNVNSGRPRLLYFNIPPSTSFALNVPVQQVLLLNVSGIVHICSECILTKSFFTRNPSEISNSGGGDQIHHHGDLHVICSACCS